MKKTSLICKLTMAALAVGLTAVSARADYVLGSWQNSVTDGGWIDWKTGLSIAYGGNATYSLADNVVPGFNKSLQITQSGWAQSLSLKLENNSPDMAAFLTNSTLSFQFSVPAATNTSGWNQIYALSLSASGFGWQNIGQPWNVTTNGWYWSTVNVLGDNNNSSGEPNYYYGPAGSLRSEIVTVNYSGILSTLAAYNSPTSGYIQLIFAPNTGGGAPNYMYMNNVVLSIPEPATAALALAGGTMALFLVRRTRKNA